MSERITVGDTPHLGNSFYNGTTLTDPTTVSLTVTDPAGVATTWTYAAAQIIKSSTGVYYRNVAVDQVGKWSWQWTGQWTGTGTVADGASGTFSVFPAALDALDVLTSDEARAILDIDPGDVTENARLASVVTAISQRMDDACGPIVRRTITAEEHTGLCGDVSFWVRLWPVYSYTTILSYDSSGTPTTLTAETLTVKPADGYLAERRDGLGAPYSGRIFRRSSGSAICFADGASVTYSAGRYSDSATVAAVFKESASVSLINWWQQVLAAEPTAGQGEFDSPGYRFPGWALPKAALDILPSTEKFTRIGIA